MSYSAEILDADNQLWLKSFEEQHGHIPRVLHIGNIANNGYLNSKILNRAGLVSDVLCNDYYHMMGCPEWEDADFDATVPDHFRPAWETFDLKGFQRPDWFAQGPLVHAIAYLIALRQGRSEDVKVLRGYLRAPPKRPLLILAQKCVRAVLPLAALRFLKRCRDSLFRLRKQWRVRREVEHDRLLAQVDASVIDMRDEAPEFDRRVSELCQQAAACFRDPKTSLVPNDLVHCRSCYQCLRDLCQEYDLVIGYSTDGILPLIAGNVPYLAFEHGTIRHIPFEDTQQGRVCAITYRLADGVLITNCDNEHAAKKLGLRNYRFVPHPINEATFAGGEIADLRRELLASLQCSFLVFHPSRQHWEERRHPSWEKGNDIFIRGFARFIKETCPTAGAVFVDWGATVKQSKQLLNELGIAKHVRWIAPVPNQQMSRYIQACDLLADQFFLGAFGSTMPKALMLGVPAMLYLNEQMHRWCFDEMPPVLNARNPDEVFEGLRQLYQEPSFAADLSRRGLDWYRKYHSNQVIANRLIGVARDVLPMPAGAAKQTG